jgi:phage N-6-adenine-methyltransferase
MKLSDEWQTPQWLFDELNKEFNFDIDLCANPYNAKCAFFVKNLLYVSASRLLEIYALYGDASILDIPTYLHPNTFTSCFMNPPYSNPKPFIQEAYDLSKSTKVVCLVKCDPSTQWWAIFWDHEKHKPKPGCEVRFLPKRVKFDPPIGYAGKITTPAFASVVVVMDRRRLSHGYVSN